MEEVIEILMNRDGMTREQAEKEIDAFKDFMNCQMAEG